MHLFERYAIGPTYISIYDFSYKYPTIATVTVMAVTKVTIKYIVHLFERYAIGPTYISIYDFSYKYPTIATVIVMAVTKVTIKVTIKVAIKVLREVSRRTKRRAEIVAIDNPPPIRRDSVTDKIAAVAIGSVGVFVIGFVTRQALRELIWIVDKEMDEVFSLNKLIYTHGYSYTVGPYPFKIGHILRAIFITLGFLAYSWTSSLIKSNPRQSLDTPDTGIIQNNLNNPIVRAIAFVANKIFQGDGSKKQTIDNIKRVLKIARNCGLVASGLLSSIKATYPNCLAWSAARNQVRPLQPISIITGIISAILDREECKKERDVARMETETMTQKAEINRQTGEINRLGQERDALREERNALWEERNALWEERNALWEERDDLLRVGLIPRPIVMPAAAAMLAHEGRG